MGIPVDLGADTAKIPRYTELKAALERGQFEYNVQLIYDIGKAAFIGGEVLSRWEHPQLGTLLPEQYIQDMYRCGLIQDLDLYMLECTCRTLEVWQRSELADLQLSCNFSRATISEADFYERFARIVDRYDFNHANLVLEITEDSIVFDTEIARQNILDCKARGFLVALDDFGVGYTSISDLCDFPVDIIKIDRSLTLKANTEQGWAVLAEMTQLAHNLDIQVLCEGVETQEDLVTVRHCGCDYIQGFYYCRVLPVDQVAEFYHQHQSE